MCESSTVQPPSTHNPPADDDPPSNGGRNYLLGVISGAPGIVAGGAFLHPELVLVGLIMALTASLAENTTLILAALVTVVSKLGILAPQLLFGSFMEHRSRKRPYWFALGAGRVVSLLALAAAIALMARDANTWTITAFFAAYFAFSTCIGAGYLVLLDMSAKMIPTGRVGRYFGTRGFLGQGLAALAGWFAVQPMLAGVRPPLNYIVMVLVAAGLFAAEAILFGMCREAPATGTPRRTTLGESLRRGFRWLKTSRNYRIYFWMRVTFRLNYLSLALFIPYGKEKLSGARGVTDVLLLGGFLVGVMKVSQVLTSFAWGKLADRRGSRPCFMAAGAAYLIAPTLGLLAPRFPQLFHLDIPRLPGGLDLPLSVYFVALAVFGAGNQAMIIGNTRFLISSAPAHRRISYVGFLNTVTGPLALLPVAGAWVAAKVGFEALLGSLLVAGVAYFLLASQIREGRAGDEAPLAR